MAALPRAELSCGWVRKSDADRSAPERSASRRSAPSRSVRASTTPRRSAARSRAPRRSASASTDGAQVVPGQVRARHPLAVRAAHGPAHAAQHVPDQTGQPVELDVEELLGAPDRVAGHLGAQGRRRRGSGVEGGRLVEQHQHLVQPLHDREDGEHLGSAVGLAAPGGAGVEDLGDVLARPEALVGRAAAHPRLAQQGVDRAAVGAVEVAARLAGVLGEGEAVRLPERQGHAAQPDAARAVRLEGGHRHMVTVLAWVSRHPPASSTTTRPSRPSASAPADSPARTASPPW